jgi:hypothetical protein
MVPTLHTLYRVSDKSNVKTKLPQADKFHCLRNFVEVFGAVNLIIYADNCTPDTIRALQQFGVPVVTLALGNAGSFIFALDRALERFSDSDHVYFVEDDYLHLPGSRDVLLEGLGIADYVTLYDHPDKYIDFGKGSFDPFIRGGGEDTKVFLTKGSHWKRTNAATMTFAARVEVLRQDYRVWSTFRTNDHAAFHRLTGGRMSLGTSWRVLKNRLSFKGLWRPRNVPTIARVIVSQVRDTFRRPIRTLIVCLPGRSTHIELKWLAPLTDWRRV